MTQITALSNEVLTIIFNSIDKISQVAECRLVCKHWNHLAETAMLGHNITINSERGLVRLYTLLVQYPEKAKLIKHLHFTYGVYYTDELFKEFLGIAVTHKIESITGDVYKEGVFFDKIIDIVVKSPVKFDNWKTLTVSADIGEPFRMLSLLLVDSIETMKVDFGDTVDDIDWRYVEQLSQFKKLKSLKIEGMVDNFGNLERILNACPPHLQSLTLTTFGWDDPHDWDQENTQKNYGLTELTLLEDHVDAHLVNYVIYKFVNLYTIVIDTQLFTDFHQINMHLVPSTISKVPSKHVTFSVPRETNLRNVLKHFKSDSYTMIVEDVEDAGDVVRLRIRWN